MGEVYRARDPRLGREVAIKVIAGDGPPALDRVRRFEQEARAVAALGHPGILAVHDVGTHDGQPYVVFELLEGETLRDRLQRGPLPPRKAVELAAQILQGLAAAHACGVVHRDLKPSNLLLTRDARVKILDFGLAKLVEPDAPGSQDAMATETGVFAPEGDFVAFDGPRIAGHGALRKGVERDLATAAPGTRLRVFPAVRRLAEPGAGPEDVQPALHGLEEDQDRAGSALARLRALSGGFAVPEDGCTTYRALYEGLARFERELHEHVHLENNVLFPRVVSLQARAEGRGGPTGGAR
jgi:serine/threonine protein kinase